LRELVSTQPADVVAEVMAASEKILGTISDVSRN
jgi:hypothetical protein